MSDPVISLVVRAHQDRDLANLQDCIRSIVASDFAAPIEILLETSNFGQTLTLESLVGTEVNWPVTLRHTNITFRGDSRLTLMRAGIRRASAPFVYLIDQDDALLRQGLAQLHGRLTQTGANIVIGNVGMVSRAGLMDRRVPYLSSAPSLAQIVAHNSVPINSFMLRRDVAQQAIEAVPNLGLYEDYAFLLNVLTQGNVQFLDPAICVAEYHIGEDHGAKYEDIGTFSQGVINDLRTTLEFRLAGQDLLAMADDLPRQRADTQVLAALPVCSDAPVQGYVDSETPWNGATLLSGWCCNTADPADLLVAVYAQTDTGSYVHLPHRHDRPDVAASLRVSNAHYGFSGLVHSARLRDVFVVYGASKCALPRRQSAA